MFRVIVYRLLINAVKLLVIDLRSRNDLLRSQVSQGTAPYFLIRKVVFLYTVTTSIVRGR